MATPTLEREDVRVRLVLTLPEKLYAHYESQAADEGSDIESVIVKRLTRCRNHTAAQPLYFTDAQRSELEQAIGHLLRNPADLIAKLRNLVTLEVAGLSIELPPEVQMRLRTRVFHGETYEVVLRREVTQALERFCGLRP